MAQIFLRNLLTFLHFQVYIYFLTLDRFYDQPVHFIHLYSSLQTNTQASFKFSTIR
jgi:hypothetical protein